MIAVLPWIDAIVIVATLIYIGFAIDLARRERK